MFKELVVTLALIAVLASMLLPLPPAVLDFLLVGNLLLALLLLVSALYISDSLKLSALPSMLLLATLYRLALNVASTRLILGQGEAGRVIQAFGSVVIGGNLVVGIAVFLVITLIQFIVIAKGSERVAEVAARFTLDALPGKQMSIDADVRAGLIDFETARKRRAEMQTESRFYGALDGAMKFVKGDAIVGLFITMVNIVGGFTIGLLAEGLGLERAISKYTILTVGDGLLAQIPALLNALAAGMVVTRVGRGDGATLASDLFSQLGQVKRAKLIISLVLVLMLAVPGMPKFPFFCLAGVLLSTVLFTSVEKTAENQVAERGFEVKSLPLLKVELGSDLAVVCQNQALLHERLQAFRREIYESQGLLLTAPQFEIVSELRHEFRLLWRGLVVCRKVVNGEPVQILEQALLALRALVCERAVECVDDILTRRTLDQFDKEAPELVSAVVPGIVSVTQLTELLKALVSEGVSIRHFDMILQAVAESGGNASRPRLLVEEVRVALGRVICQKYIDAEGRLKAFVLDPAIDMVFVKTERESQPFDSECITVLMSFLRSRPVPVLLASKGARRLLKEILNLQGLDVAVLAHEEIPRDVPVAVQGRVPAVDSGLTEKIIEQLAA